MRLEKQDLIEREDLLAANRAFEKKMLRAIAKGREGAVPGTHVDVTPLLATRYQAEPRTSGCGSSSAMCLEGGEA